MVNAPGGRVNLFAAVAEFLPASDCGAPADCAQLNDWLEQIRPRPLTAGGRPMRFVAPDRSGLNYEERIFASGEVVTRPANWHDFFNALVWMRFPHTKAALNALHVRQMRAHRSHCGRGPLRDAATQFDESGIVVASADPSLLDLLARRCWKELFWARRQDVLAHMRFVVFGHGLYDALRAPFYRMCGRAATIQIEPEIAARDAVALCRHLDAILAARFAACDWYPRPRALLALPLLGIPGVTPDSESPAYYEDTEQFRPPPAWV
jgi:hypothetical protein